MSNVRTIAKEAGVSIATVSRVLNAHPGVAPRSRDAVLKAVNELNYQPKVGRRSVAEGIALRAYVQHAQVRGADALRPSTTSRTSPTSFAIGSMPAMASTRTSSQYCTIRERRRSRSRARFLAMARSQGLNFAGSRSLTRNL